MYVIADSKGGGYIGCTLDAHFVRIMQAFSGIRFMKAKHEGKVIFFLFKILYHLLFLFIFRSQILASVRLTIFSVFLFWDYLGSADTTEHFLD